MGKTFLYKRISDEQFSETIRKYLFELRGFEIEESEEGESEFIARSKYGVLGFYKERPKEEYFVKIVTSPNVSHADIKEFERELDNLGMQGLFISFHGLPQKIERINMIILDAYDIETLFYPLELIKRGRKAIIYSIEKEYADVLIPQRQQTVLIPEKLLLRTDHVYYRWPDRYRELRRGAPILFYVSGEDIRGEAKLVEYEVESPETLYEKYERLGVYGLRDLQNIAKGKGRVLAVKFDWYTEYPKPVPYDKVKEIIPRFNPITANKITYDDVIKIRGWGERESGITFDKT
ncbi:MAG: hypothetical protein QMC78_04030 [Methanocellales archaeon]|nr:hypothetical protein [Methanocellales archaeon]